MPPVPVMRSSWHRQRRRRAADPGEAAIASLDLLAAPARALMFPGEPAGTRWSDQLVELAEQLHAAADWPVLAQVYQHAADVAWRDGCRRASVRLLLAERVLAQRAGDEHRVLESTFFLASRHRLQASFVAAEAWAWQVVRAPVTPDSAVIQVGALRELASVREMQSRYESGLLLCDQAEAMCRQYAEAPGMAAAHVKTLLHRSVLERLQGAVDRAAAAVRQAATLAEAAGVDELTLGMVALREGGL